MINHSKKQIYPVNGVISCCICIISYIYITLRKKIREWMLCLYIATNNGDMYRVLFFFGWGECHGLLCVWRNGVYVKKK